MKFLANQTFEGVMSTENINALQLFCVYCGEQKIFCFIAREIGTRCNYILSSLFCRFSTVPYRHIQRQIIVQRHSPLLTTEKLETPNLWIEQRIRINIR